MKLSKATQNILNGLSQINSNLIIKPGNKLSSCSAAKNIFAFVDVEETFATEFGIYDLREFLGAISIFDDPDIEFGDKYATISEGNSSIRYLSADCSILISPKGQPKPPSVDVEFSVTADQISKVVKTAAVLKVGFVSVIGDGEKIQLKVHDKANKNSNQFAIDVGVTENTFAVHFKIDVLKMPPDNYNVQISKKMMAQFTGEKKVYVIGAETDSTFE